MYFDVDMTALLSYGTRFCVDAKSCNLFYTGVLKAVKNVELLAAAIKGMDPTDQEAIDKKVYILIFTFTCTVRRELYHTGNYTSLRSFHEITWMCIQRSDRISGFATRLVISYIEIVCKRSPANTSVEKSVFCNYHVFEKI